jgi:multidrug efflux pump subunit AcrB
MWFVNLALRRPYTFIVLALLLPLVGAVVLLGTPLRGGMATDIFPEIRIPVISVTYQYGGLAPEEIAGRMTSNLERQITTIVNDVEHVESQSYQGVTVVKIYFQPGADINLAMAQVTAFAQSNLRQMPPGTTPPSILKYTASSVPIMQLALSSATQTESQLFDFSNQVIRSQIGTIPGASVPNPFGGATRQVQVDLMPEQMRARGLTGSDISEALGNQSFALPSGTQKIGDIEYAVRLNSSPRRIEDLNDVPLRNSGGAITWLRDVAYVHDGHPPQTNIVRVDGRRAVLNSIMKTGSSSTLSIIEEIKRRLPFVRETAPEGTAVAVTGDQSVFVKAAIHGVAMEAAIAAALTALMILLFLGSWRSTLIITVSIPLSIIASIVLLAALGETLNLMTLGGLALAVGILVDDATVTIENINRHLEEGLPVEPAILEGSRQILVPALVSTLSICIVFVPMFLLTGVARYLFVPMAEAVVFAMLTSWLLSRTLVPTLASYWLRPHAGELAARARANAWQRFQQRFEAGVNRFRDVYRGYLYAAIHHQKAFIPLFLGAVLLSMPLLPLLGRNFFPEVDAGQIKLHLRAPAGTRVEETAVLVDRVGNFIRGVIPPGEINSFVDNIGLPTSGINLTYGNSGTIGVGDADIFIALKDGHGPTAGYVAQLRQLLPEQFPAASFAFLPADIVSQILNFGQPASIDVQISGNSPRNRDIARQLMNKLRQVPGLVDLRIQQSMNRPELRVNADRARAQQLGFTPRDVASNMLLVLAGSGQVSPSYWLNPDTGVQYPIVAQAPQHRMASLSDLQNVPLGKGTASQLLSGVATVTRGFGPDVISRYDSQPVTDILGATQDRDLGSVAREIRKAIASFEGQLPRGTRINVRGQIHTMESSYTGLAIGIAGAILLVYLLIVVNFQSWLDAFIIITALPAVLAGILWMLLATGTTLSVPALTGAIMCVGVATANSVLMVSFARERLAAGLGAMDAAMEAGTVRFRPVLMTALAMMIGMSPMALGLGEGGEQNAPLGRAVIGGLLFGTAATLLFVPAVFARLHRNESTSAPATNPAPAMAS